MHTPNLPALVRSFYGPMTRRLLRIAGWLALGVYFCFALLVLGLRYAVLPQIDNYRGDIEAALSRSLKQPVSIGAIDAGWSGLRPRLAIRDLAIHDREGRAVLGFDDVLAELAWSSFWHLGLHLHRLEIASPELDIRRDANGRYFVAGLEVTPSGDDTGFADWLLAQDRIVVRDAMLRWHDELRAAPPLVLRQLNFDLQNNGMHHRFGFTAEPPQQMAARLDVRGDLHGTDVAIPAAWKGDVYAELDYADLAVWRTWVDYPFELPRGAGGLRLWFSFAGGQPTGATADLRLADVALRLEPGLPMLELAHLEGRLAARRQSEGYEASAQRVALATKDGIRIEPTDLRLRLRTAAANRPASGELDADGLDLGALAALAAHLPFDDAMRERLATYAPRGRLSGLKLSWTGSAGDLKSWHVAGRFADLGLAAAGTLPGFAGLSGNIDGDEKSGRLTLDSQQAAMELPAVFADPRLGLSALSAQLKWKANADGVDIELAHATFKNHDAIGEASGRYRRGHDGGLGDIDLTAKLTQAAGNAVWRYMPLVVNRDVRDWLRGAIEGGIADEATLRLKGDLRKFPFKGGKDGIFEVKGRFRGATLRYAPGWPEIRNLDGTLQFEGTHMLIQGQRGSIAGVGIGPVTAEIADLESVEELLTVEGRASGATTGFLRFIESSPVGDRIDHFTEDMSAEGAGELQLRLAMPLRRLADTKIDGRFRFIGNRLALDPDMPPLTDVNGDLRFTADRLDAQKIRGAMFGMPLVVDIATAGDGAIRVKAAGSVAIAALRRQFGHPLLDHLSGTAPWNGTLRVKKKSVDLRIESTLQGIASSLPEPFNKTTNAVLPLVVERKQGAAAGRDTLNVSLDDALKVTLMRRHEQAKTVVERGVIAVGTAPKLPERGVLLAVQAKRLDFDAWRKLGGDAGGSGGGDAMPVTQLDLRADEFIAYGRDVTHLRVTGAQSGGVWKADVRSAEAVGNLEWDGRGAGRISGHLSRLALSESATGGDAAAEIPEEMPAVDLAIDRFAVAGKEFGALRIKAANEADGFWNAKFDVKNDDATLEGTGRWRPRTNPPETRLDFKLGTKSIEKLLVRLGYPDAVRRGTAHLEGALAWNGGPLAPDYPTLSGHVKFEAAGGQFNKLEPGVGRLLGVISLQSLPRRLTLDFRDIFSEGFAFDAIAGEAAVAQGVMTTNNLQIAGPAAKILMTGNVNLVKETQNLNVSVQPAIGETLATGVLLTHPVAGAAAWVFNKLFGNPFDVAFAYQFAVTGSWADPKVEKLAGPAQDAAKEGRK